MTESTAASSALSKSKKKRMKRDKAKQRKEDQVVEPEHTIRDDGLNTHDKLRSELVKLGFELADVDKAMEDMWNQQLDYTDFDAVLGFIENAGINSGSSGNSSGSVNGNGIGIGIEEKELDPPAAPDTVVTVESFSSPSSPSCSGKGPPDATEEPVEMAAVVSEPVAVTVAVETVVVAVEPIEIESSRPEESADVDVDVDVDVEERKMKPRVKPFELSSKLDIVANSDNLTDGIIALTEWVVKAATPPQIKEVCSGTTTNALQTVIRRSILSRNSNSTGQLLDLIGSILRTVGAPSAQLMASAKALGLLLRHASQAMDVDESFNYNIATSVAQNAVAAVGNVVDQIINNSKSSVNTMKRLDGEIEQLEIANAKNAGAGIMDLMMKRDKCKSIVEKSSSFLEVSIHKSPAEPLISTTGTLGENDVMKNMLGDQYKSIVSSQAKFDELKTRERSSSSSFDERDALVSNVNSLNADKKRIASRMEQLRGELEQLALDEKLVKVKIQDSQSKLTALEGSLSGEAKEVKGELDSVAKKLKVEECVSQIAQQVCDFASTMDSLSTSLSSNGVQDHKSAGFPNALVSLVKATRCYFSSELKTIAFLKKRAGSIDTEIPTLQREIKEFEALGMASTVADMKKKEKEMLDNMLDDNDLIDALIGEADVAKLTFVEQLEGYFVSSAFDQTEQESYASTLQQINKILTEIGVPADARWANLMVMYSASAPSSSMVAPLTPVRPKKKTTGWNLSQPVGTNRIKSLLDIQNEESQSSSTN